MTGTCGLSEFYKHFSSAYSCLLCFNKKNKNIMHTLAYPSELNSHFHISNLYDLVINSIIFLFLFASFYLHSYHVV